jgi:rhamnosyltransferase
MSKSNRIFAIIVSYYPNFEKLKQLIYDLKTQVKQIIIVDNTPTHSLEHNSFSDWFGVHYVSFGENWGVASAQNFGINWACEQGAEFVMLFDQDSRPHEGMVWLQYCACLRLLAKGVRVGAVGPRYVDERNDEHPSFSRLKGIKLINSTGKLDGNIVPVDFVISSGALIPMHTLRQVGLMASELFIDQIDIEWGFRAKSMGYRSFGISNALMDHSLGETPLEFCGRKLLNHSPLRHYYIFRNAVWLIHRNYTPLGWRLYFFKMICIRWLIYTLFVRPRMEYFKMMVRGVWHGLIGKTGKYSE